MILCGWCGGATPEPRCVACGHADPARPWLQRGQEPPEVAVAPGRHPVEAVELRRRLSSLGPRATDEQIAAAHEVDPRTVRRWRQKVSA